MMQLGRFFFVCVAVMMMTHHARIAASYTMRVQPAEMSASGGWSTERDNDYGLCVVSTGLTLGSRSMETKPVTLSVRKGQTVQCVTALKARSGAGGVYLDMQLGASSTQSYFYTSTWYSKDLPSDQWMEYKSNVFVASDNYDSWTLSLTARNSVSLLLLDTFVFAYVNVTLENPTTPMPTSVPTTALPQSTAAATTTTPTPTTPTPPTTTPSTSTPDTRPLCPASAFYNGPNGECVCQEGYTYVASRRECTGTYYKIRSELTRQALTGKGKAASVEVNDEKTSDFDDQLWIMLKEGSLMNKLSGLVLDIENFDPEYNTRIISWSQKKNDTRNDNQLFVYNTSTHQFETRISSYWVLDVAEKGGGKVVIWSKKSGGPSINQRFNIEPYVV